MKKVKFMLVAQIEGLTFNPAQPSGIKLHRSGRRALTATLIPGHPEDDPFGHRRGLVCKLRRSYPVDENLFQFIDRLNSRVFTPYPEMTITLPHVASRGGVLIASDGTLSEGYRLAWKHYPKELKEICTALFDELTTETQRFIKLLTWFFNTSHVHSPVRHQSLYWNTRGRNFHVVKLPSDSSGYWQNDVVWNEPKGTDFVSLWKSASEEPLAHELFREAGSLLRSTPRSALLMLASALEAGVKSYISERAPVTQWLLTESQSPPIPKMLRELVPNLRPAGAVSLLHWSNLRPMFKRIIQLTEERNRLTHRGTMEVKSNQLDEFKEDVSDVLYILDYLNGVQWAINNIRRETCQALKWPDPIPTQQQIRVTMVAVD